MQRPSDHELPELEVPGGDERAQEAPACSLHICPRCGSGLVQPTCWQQGRDHRAHWRVWRRCPECGWRGEGLYDEKTIDAYDEQLDQGTHQLADELRALQQANMRELADVFVAALRRDLIGADDFSRGG